MHQRDVTITKGPLATTVLHKATGINAVIPKGPTKKYRRKVAIIDPRTTPKRRLVFDVDACTGWAVVGKVVGLMTQVENGTA